MPPPDLPSPNPLPPLHGVIPKPQPPTHRTSRKDPIARVRGSQETLLSFHALNDEMETLRIAKARLGKGGLRFDAEGAAGSASWLAAGTRLNTPSGSEPNLMEEGGGKRVGERTALARSLISVASSTLSLAESWKGGRGMNGGSSSNSNSNLRMVPGCKCVRCTSQANLRQKGKSIGEQDGYDRYGHHGSTELEEESSSLTLDSSDAPPGVGRMPLAAEASIPLKSKEERDVYLASTGSLSEPMVVQGVEESGVEELRFGSVVQTENTPEALAQKPPSREEMRRIRYPGSGPLAEFSAACPRKNDPAEPFKRLISIDSSASIDNARSREAGPPTKSSQDSIQLTSSSSLDLESSSAAKSEPNLISPKHDVLDAEIFKSRWTFADNDHAAPAKPVTPPSAPPCSTCGDALRRSVDGVDEPTSKVAQSSASLAIDGIMGEYVAACEGEFHPRCFTCEACGKEIHGRFKAQYRKAYCIEHAPADSGGGGEPSDSTRAVLQNQLSARLPVEVWCAVIEHAVGGSLSELARLSTINKDIRAAAFHSVSVRCDALIKAFGRSHVLAAIIDGSVLPPAPASPAAASGVVTTSTAGDATSMIQPGIPTPMSVFLSQLDDEDSEEDSDEDDSDDSEEEEEEEEENDDGADVMDGTDSGGTLNGHAGGAAIAVPSTPFSTLPAGISNASVPVSSASSSLSSVSSSINVNVYEADEVDVACASSSSSSLPLLLPNSGSSSSMLAASPSADLVDDDTPAAVSPPSPALAPSRIIKPDPRVWIFGASILAQDSTAINSVVPGVPGPRLLSALVHRGAHITVNDGTPLRVVVEKGRSDLVRALLVPGRDAHAEGELRTRGRDAVDFRDGSGLRHACRQGDVEVVKALLECGADVHVRRDEALRFASHAGNIDIVSLLLQHGADPTAMHHAALFNAADMGHLDVVRILLTHPNPSISADPNATLHGLSHGRNLLKNPATFGNVDMVKLLLELGTSVGHMDSVALKEARRCGHTAVVEVLEAAIAAL
ncbi:hypothetical protein HDU67_008451 [Dinochytrium kinnereticum]|nr:hypothetical protein HDU67_008451 [Dinochytrium kinnereticum]